MTETERIIDSGLIRPEFLQEEMQCGFLVSQQRKKLFAVILDLLVVFDEICKKHDLRYYLHSGSLLGAIRHRGFIPWDDDLDVAMPRDDYERFIQLTDEFKEPYFLQTPYTDKGYFYSFAKLRNTNTTAVVDLFKYAGFNQGIWISMFPLDFWDENGGRERYLEISKLVAHNSTYMRVSNPYLSEKDKLRVKAYQAEQRDPMHDFEEMHRLASFCKDPNSKYVTTAVITQSRYEDKIWDASDYASAVQVKFEGLSLPAPCGYEHLLTQWYGDYMKFPPIEERGEWHPGIHFDAEIPYKEYLRKQGIS